MTMTEFAESELKRHLQNQQSKEDNELDVWFAQQMLETIPPFFEACSNRNIFSNLMATEIALDVVNRLAHYKPIHPIQFIEDNPDDWITNDPIDPNLIQCKRCPSVFFDKEKNKYFDVDIQPIFRERFSAVGWTGQPLDTDAARQYVPNFMDRYLRSFEYNTNIVMPYYPSTEHEEVVIDWYDELMCDVVNFLCGFKAEDMKPNVMTSTFTSLDIYMAYLNKFKTIVTIFKMPDKFLGMTNYPYLVLPYQYELKDMPTIVSRTIQWARKYLDTSEPTGFIKVEGPALDRDHRLDGVFPVPYSAISEAQVSHRNKDGININIMAGMEYICVFNQSKSFLCSGDPTITWAEITDHMISWYRKDPDDMTQILLHVYDVLQDYEDACERRRLSMKQNIPSSDE